MRLVPFARLFHQYVWRDFFRNRVRVTLTLCGIALGVAVVVAVQIANERAIGSFNDNLRLLNGQADLQVGGNGLPLNENLISTLAWVWDYGVLSPIIEGRARIKDAADPIYILGVDFVADGAFRKYIAVDETDLAETISSDEFIDILQDPENVVIPDLMASRFEIQKGTTLPLLIGDSLRTVKVGAILRNEGIGRAFGGNVIFMDIAAAQLALNRLGQIDRIDIRLTDKSQSSLVEARIGMELPANALVYRTESAIAQNDKLVRAFRYNLTALSYVALIVGVILVYNTLTVTVIRRRPEVGALRALGTSRPTIAAMFILESAVLGFFGSVAGALLGHALAIASSVLVSQTMQSLYTGFFTLSKGNTVDLPLTIGAIIGGTLLAVVSGAAPALRATAIAPASVLREGSVLSSSRTRTWTVVAGLIIFLVGVALSFAGPIQGFPLFGYAAAVCFIAGAGLTTAPIATISTRCLGAGLVLVSPVVGRLAVQSMRSGIRRVAVAVFSLAIAVSMLVSVATMVASFRSTVIAWVNQTLRADLYVRPASAGANEWESSFDPKSVERLAELPSIAAIDRFRGRPLEFNGSTVVVAGGELSVVGKYGQLLFTDGRTARQVAEKMPGQDRIIVSEPFAIKQGVKKAGSITLPTADGPIPFQIEGIYYDYSNDRGLLVMDRSTYLRRFRDPSVTNIAIYLKSGISTQQAQGEIAEKLTDSHLRILTNGDLKRQVLTVFDQTFQITYALEAIAIAVAVLGIANTLGALILERRSEFAVLRFMGTKRVELNRITLTESGLIGVIGMMLGTAIGLVLSVILVYVINRQSFGWTIQFGVPVGFLLRSLTLTFAATVLAGIYPAALAQRLDPLISIRAE